MRGKVWLVGGGPGDPELLTVKGRRILEEADVVVYDRLIGSGILRCAPLGAELIDVGKNGGCHPVPQEEIEKILIEKALENKRVVRLKGGDPFLFGRGGEEMSTLMSRGIPCEPVPGVTSAIAVPAWAGIPVTHRDYASSIHIVTAHRRDGAPIDYDALAPLKGTLVFLMGASALRDICEGLIAAGMDKNTPAAAIQRGTTARQKQVIGVLADLPERAAQSKGIHAPAVMVVGQVVALSETLNWRAALPLAGRRVLVPRPESHLPQKGGSGGRSGRLAALLRARGAEVVEVSPSRMENIDLPLPPLGGYLWLVFTSGTGVECFFQRLRADQRDIREIGTAKIAAIGSMTRNAIEERGLRVDLVPSAYSGAALAEALVDELESASPAASGPLLLLRAERGAPDLTRILRDRGVSFDEVPLYRTVPFYGALHERNGLEVFDLEDIDAVAFTCASSVRALAALCPHIGVKAACIGKQTEKAALDAGYETALAKKATLEDLADALEKLLELPPS